MGRIKSGELPGHGLGMRSVGEKYQRVKAGCVVCAQRIGIEGLLGKLQTLKEGKVRWKGWGGKNGFLEEYFYVVCREI